MSASAPGPRTALSLVMPQDTVDALFDEFEKRLSIKGAEPASSSPWLTAQEAADYIRAPLSRVRKLTMTRELPSEQEGRRRLYHRDALDDFIRRGGAKSP